MYKSKSIKNMLNSIQIKASTLKKNQSSANRIKFLSSIILLPEVGVADQWIKYLPYKSGSLETMQKLGRCGNQSVTPAFGS